MMFLYIPTLLWQVHLFDVDVPNGPVLMESRTTAPGDTVRPYMQPQPHMRSALQQHVGELAAVARQQPVAAWHPAWPGLASDVVRGRRKWGAVVGRARTRTRTGSSWAMARC